MKAVFNYIISPVSSRYNNKKVIDTENGEKEIILNTEIFNHQYVSRNATVLAVPTQLGTPISVGDEVVVHHNIFRRWHDVRGVERNSSSFISETEYICSPDQLFLYKKDKDWMAMDGYSFIQPVEETDKMSTEKEKELVGIVRYIDNSEYETVAIGDLVGFTPSSEFEFIVNGVRMYRVLTKDICFNYGDNEGKEKAYNPSWAKGS